MKYKFKPSHIILASLFVVTVLYGGSKPPCPTNTPADNASSPTNLIDSVTLFAYGKIVLGPSPSRTMETNLLCTTTTSNYDYSLPMAVSLEPNASTLTHGQTPSNSYLFSWHNCCVNRSATNRVNASIELFRSGACSVRFDTVETIYPAPVPPSALASAVSWDNELYGVDYDPLFLCGQLFAAPPDDVLRLSLSATAQNATDGLRKTCVQIVVYPVDANGNPIGLPTWVVL